MKIVIEEIAVETWQSKKLADKILDKVITKNQIRKIFRMPEKTKLKLNIYVICIHVGYIKMFEYKNP